MASRTPCQDPWPLWPYRGSVTATACLSFLFTTAASQEAPVPAPGWGDAAVTEHRTNASDLVSCDGTPCRGKDTIYLASVPRTLFSCRQERKGCDWGQSTENAQTQSLAGRDQAQHKHPSTKLAEQLSNTYS